MYLSGFKSLESLESLARLLKKVLKSCETFKIQDFANASSMHVPRRMYNMGCRNTSIESIALQVKQLVPPVGSDGHENRSWVCRMPNRISLLFILFLGSSKWSNAFNLDAN